MKSPQFYTPQYPIFQKTAVGFPYLAGAGAGAGDGADAGTGTGAGGTPLAA